MPIHRRKNTSFIGPASGTFVGNAGLKGASGGGAFDPTTLNPLHWYDAGDDTTITRTGSNVTAWADKGSINTTLSALEADDPQYTADDPSTGVGSIEFVRTNAEALDTGSNATGADIPVVEGTEVYIWLVFKTDLTGTNQFMAEIPTDATSGGKADTQAIIALYPTFSNRVTFNNSSASGMFDQAFTWAPDTNIHCVEVHYTGEASPYGSSTAVNFKLDNVAKTTLNTGVFTGSFDNDIRIGGVTSVRTDGKIYELFISNNYNAGMYTYLADKWGIS